MIVLHAQVGGVQSLKDKTIKLTFETQELKPNEAGILYSMQNEAVSLGISRNALTDEELNLLSNERLPIEAIPNKKSPSKRLRDVLYVLGQQKGEEDSEEHYQRMMNQIIQFYKSKLEGVKKKNQSLDRTQNEWWTLCLRVGCFQNN